MSRYAVNIDSDNRFGPMSQKVAAILRGLFYQKQLKIVADVKEQLEEAGFSFKGIVRTPDGSGGDNLREILLENSDQNKIIFLTATLINPQDAALLAPETVMKWFGNFAKLRYPALEMETTPQGYISYTTKVVNNRFYEDSDGTLVIGVLNTNIQDIKDVIKLGGDNTVLVLAGHGGEDSFATSDGELVFTSITRPKELLRAIIKHACNQIDSSHRGTLAKEIYSWNRRTNPIVWALNTFGEA